MADVFMCYSHEDTVYASDLIEELFGRRVEVFDFTKNIPTGSDWFKTIEENLKSSSVVIPILTPAAAASKVLQREIEFAIKNGKVILPLLLEGEIWPSLQSIQYLDVRDGSLPQKEFFETIEKIIGESKSTESLSTSIDRTKDEILKDALSKQFDVYVSYNSHDRPDLANEIVHVLESKRLNTWFGEKYLKDVENWREVSRKALEKTSALLVLIGSMGLGAGQREELTLALSFPHIIFIPVLLPGTTLDDLPEFLNYQDWIDFRTGLDNKASIRNLNKIFKKNAPSASAQAKGANIVDDDAPLEFVNQIVLYKLEKENRSYELEEKEAASRTKQVLNANFAYSHQGRLLKPRDGLVEGGKYRLLVDIGERWKKNQSIAQGKIEIGNILSGDDDYVIQAVFISDDFEPKMVSAEMLVQANRERSFPIINGELSKEPGPVELWVNAPRFPKGYKDSSFTVHGRLCLYYKNYLLQSAVVSVGIVREPSVKLNNSNKIKVDYIFTGNFAEVRKQLENRRIHFDKIGEISKPVSLNLTMNSDGYGHHRILAKYNTEDKRERNLQPACKNYDPETGKIFLAEFRAELKDCYKEIDLSKYKNKREKFIADLTALARVGSKLRAAIFDNDDLVAPDGQTQEEWGREITQGTFQRNCYSGFTNWLFQLYFSLGHDL